MSMVVSELHFLQIEREHHFRDSVMLNQPFLRIRPEALQAVYINLSGAEPSLMVDSEMAVTAEHQRVVAMELVGINDAASTDHLNCHAQEGLGRDVGHNLDFDHPLALEDAEYRDFTGCSPSTVVRRQNILDRFAA